MGFFVKVTVILCFLFLSAVLVVLCASGLFWFLRCSGELLFFWVLSVVVEECQARWWPWAPVVLTHRTATNWRGFSVSSGCRVQRRTMQSWILSPRRSSDQQRLGVPAAGSLCGTSEQWLLSPSWILLPVGCFSLSTPFSFPMSGWKFDLSAQEQIGVAFNCNSDLCAARVWLLLPGWGKESKHDALLHWLS